LPFAVFRLPRFFGDRELARVSLVEALVAVFFPVATAGNGKEEEEEERKRRRRKAREENRAGGGAPTSRRLASNTLCVCVCVCTM
jgi:hypothetical protein